MTLAPDDVDPAIAGQLESGRRWGRLLVIIGSCWVVLGGLVAAVTGPFNWTNGSWAAAYLVLVVGMTQVMVGHARSYLGLVPPDDRRPWIELLAWNLGNLLVLGGTLTGLPLVADLGGVALLAVLIIEFGRAARNNHRVLAIGYRIVLILLILSIPVGLVLGHLNNA